jgi:hypothetical protein
MTKEQRFNDLQQKWRAASEADRVYRIDLAVRYSAVNYAPSAKRRKSDQLNRAESRARERFYTFLHTISPRDWSASVPCAWVCHQLTFADAITSGHLSIVPYPAYGYTEHDTRAFARPVEAR